MYVYYDTITVEEKNMIGSYGQSALNFYKVRYDS